MKNLLFLGNAGGKILQDGWVKKGKRFEFSNKKVFGWFALIKWIRESDKEQMERNE